MRKVVVTLTVVALVGGIPTMGGRGQEPKKEPGKVGELMRRKLQHSQKVLEAVALNDHKLIARHADELIDISKAAEWRAIKTPQYELSSNEFRRIAESLVQNAKDKNLDGAALNYVELTLTCVKCHKYVREVRQARLDEPAGS